LRLLAGSRKTRKFLANLPTMLAKLQRVSTGINSLLPAHREIDPAFYNRFIGGQPATLAF